MNGSYEFLLREFRDPSRDYMPLLMWFWNDVITEEQITFQLEQFRGQNITNFFIHPANGFGIEYLSDRYMELIRYTVREARRLGMHYWIYDEYEFPSGTAGGLLCLKYPQYRKKQLRVVDRTLRCPGDRVAISSHGTFVGAQLLTEKEGKNYVQDIADDCRLETAGGITRLTYRYQECSIAGRALFYFCETDLRALPSGMNRVGADQIEGYVDMLDPAAVGKFIELTHERYRQFIGDEFGKTVRGVFCDEPTPNITYFYDALGIWNDTFPAEFEKDHGYSILPWLYTLWSVEAKTPEEIRAQSDYRATVKRLYFAAFMKQIGAWCQENGLIFTGHFGGEENLMNQVAQGDMLEELMLFHMPGADSILSVDRIETPEFNIAGKLASSAAKFSGSDRVLCETYTGSGWRLRFSMMKRIANRLILLGINWIQYMGAFYTVGAASKNFPLGFAPSHNYQNTLFAHYNALNRYLARFQALSANTKPDSHALLFIPLEQTIHDRHNWIRGKWSEKTAFASCYERFFIDTVNALLFEGIGFDLFSENMADQIAVHDGFAEVFGCRYDALIFPRMQFVNAKTKALLEDLRVHGVKTVFTHALPSVNVDTGARFDAGYDLKPFLPAANVRADGCTYFIDPPDFPLDMGLYRMAFREVVGGKTLNICADKGIYISKRCNEEAEVYFLCNDSHEPSAACFDALPGMRILDAVTGEEAAYTVENSRVSLTLDGWEMLAIVRDRQGTEIPATTLRPASEAHVLTLKEPYDFRTADGNYLPLNYEMYDEDLREWAACQFMHYAPGIHLRPGGAYRLRARVRLLYLPQKVWLNAEVMRTTRLAVNGTELPFCVNTKRWSPDDYTAEISGLLHEGENLIELDGYAEAFAKFGRPQYLYLSGDFGVDAHGALTAPVHAVYANGWEKNGYPYFCGDGIYTAKLTVENGFRKALLTIPTEDIAAVYVNGSYAGKRLWPGREMDLTDFLQTGENELEVRITSTRANMFGCRADGFGESVFYGSYADERTENGLLAPMQLHLTE